MGWHAHTGAARPAGIAADQWVEARFNTSADAAHDMIGGIKGKAEWICWENVTSWRHVTKSDRRAPTGWRPTEQERAVYEHYLAGSTKGDLYVHVKRGQMGVVKPDRSQGNAFAAWMAGRELARIAALALLGRDA